MMSFPLITKPTDDASEMGSLNLSPRLFAQAFPFHIVFNQDLEILQVGEVLHRVCPTLALGNRLSHHFRVIRPSIAVDFNLFQKRSQSVFLLECLQSQLQLKGQMSYDEERNIFFFLCSPWVTDITDLAPIGIKFKDFPIHDSICDFLMLLQMRSKALSDTQRLTTELTQKQVLLEEALKVQAQLAQKAETQARTLESTLGKLQSTQAQLIQTEKMSSLGQLVAGVAHEINNPVSFIFGNLQYAENYIQDLVQLIKLYQKYSQTPLPLELKLYLEESDLEFTLEDLPKLLKSMQVGCHRIRDIVTSLRTFSRLDEAEVKPFNIHDGIDSTLLILQSRLKADSHRSAIEISKHYGEVPLVECNGGQLNQVFMNLISNAIDALESHNSQRSLAEIQAAPSRISITTKTETNRVLICIADNGSGITEEVRARLFDPFFTTKPIGKGTGLGLSISYQVVVDKHAGTFWCESEPGQGAAFWIDLPVVFEQTTEETTALQEVLLAHA